MTYLISAVTYIFDIFIVSSYLKNMLKHFKKKYSTIYILCLILVEVILYINELLSSRYNSFSSVVITPALSILTTFALCCFFSNSIKARILTALSFQVLVSLGESFFTFIITHVNPDILDMTNKTLLYSIMNLGSKVMLFLLCLIVTIFFRNQKYDHPTEYSILLFTTPIITLVIFSFTPLHFLSENDNVFFYEMLFLCLSMLNIVNYILIQRAFISTVVNYTNMNIQRQLDFQKGKFEQLSESYRQNRRIIHDVKKHYFYIQEQINKQHFDDLKNYTSTAIQSIEDNYAKYNTGNLVIDSFITNYDNIATKNNIAFYVRLNVDFNRVPTNDYDLCIILGNLLDNCIAACIKCNNSRYINISIETTDNDKFVIHCENRSPVIDSTARQHSIDHGFGLSNISHTVEKNNGFFVYQQKNDIFYTDIMIPIIDESKRVFKSVNHISVHPSSHISRHTDIPVPPGRGRQ